MKKKVEEKSLAKIKRVRVTTASTLYERVREILDAARRQVARQKRLTIDGDHFHIDLVLYNRLLRSFVLIDLKIGKLMHQDIGQMMLYTNFYTREMLEEWENPTVGILLCADKNDAVVRYATPYPKPRIAFSLQTTNFICRAKKKFSPKLKANEKNSNFRRLKLMGGEIRIELSNTESATGNK